ncbi:MULTISPECIES: HepT-like ribonuclease domain-containing protein [unclassified Carboxylicivirga]|uniref:HepT-like ribonuclease domain-containing protein n=1 Tax=Carboxylicivirga TaxID=1628153 RepID=UPI003D343F74
MNRALNEDTDLEVENARKIVDTRNWVIYGYDKVDDVIIWGIISKHLPKLKREIEAYLKKNASCQQTA